MGERDRPNLQFLRGKIRENAMEKTYVFYFKTIRLCPKAKHDFLSLAQIDLQNIFAYSAWFTIKEFGQAAPLSPASLWGTEKFLALPKIGHDLQQYISCKEKQLRSMRKCNEGKKEAPQESTAQYLTEWIKPKMIPLICSGSEAVEKIFLWENTIMLECSYVTSSTCKKESRRVLCPTLRNERHSSTDNGTYGKSPAAPA